jgi:hypothetical protein
MVDDDIENEFDEKQLVEGISVKRNVVYTLMKGEYYSIGNVVLVSDNSIHPADFSDDVCRITFYRKFKKNGVLKYFVIVMLKDCLQPPLKEFVTDRLLKASLDNIEIYYKINRNIHIWGRLGAVEILESDDIKILVNVTDIQNKDGELINVLPKEYRKDDKNCDVFNVPSISGDGGWNLGPRIRKWRKRQIGGSFG